MGIFIDFFNLLDSLGADAESGGAAHEGHVPSLHIWEGPGIFEPAPPAGIAWKEDE